MGSRKTRTPVTTDEPVAEATEPEATEPSDEEVQAAIAEAIAENQAKYAAANRQISVTDLYDEFTQLILAKVKGTRYAEFRTEQSAIKVFELTLFWAMNNRQQPAPVPQIPTVEVGGEGEGRPRDLRGRGRGDDLATFGFMSFGQNS